MRKISAATIKQVKLATNNASSMTTQKVSHLCMHRNHEMSTQITSNFQHVNNKDDKNDGLLSSNATIIVPRDTDTKLNWTMHDEQYVNIVVCPSNQSDFEKWQVANDWSAMRYRTAGVQRFSLMVNAHGSAFSNARPFFLHWEKQCSDAKRVSLFRSILLQLSRWGKI